MREKLILVVDDDEAVRTAVASVLRHEGLRVACAQDGAHALRSMEAECRPSLVFLDLVMPRMSGWQVLDVMSGRQELADIPVVVLTALDVGDSLPSGRLALHKPVDADVLCECAKELLLLASSGSVVTAPRRAQSTVCDRNAAAKPYARAAGTAGRRGETLRLATGSSPRRRRDGREGGALHENVTPSVGWEKSASTKRSPIVSTIVLADSEHPDRHRLLHRRQPIRRAVAEESSPPQNVSPSA